VACPCGFEPQTYALEAVKMRLNNSLDNGFKALVFNVQQAPRILESDGVAWIRLGINRRLNGRAWNLLG